MLSASQITRITSVASPALSDSRPDVRIAGKRGSELQSLLETRNGFFAFESALHVLPSVASFDDGTGQTMSAENWNAPATWKCDDDGMADDLWCFAEDIFGVQFAVHRDSVVSFDPETGDLQQIAEDIGGWIDAILDGYQSLTGYPLADEWQREYGALRPAQRLIPKIPFALAGSFHVSNLFAEDAVKGMRFRGNLAIQIRDLPDGSPVQYLPTV